MKVLVADAFEQHGLDGLAAAGCDVVYRPGLDGDALAGAIHASAADVLIVRGTRVTETMLGAGALSLVVRAGAGYNTIDVAAASRRGIYVANCPGKNAVAVAELVFALILSLDRRVPDNVADLRAGRWNKAEYSKARGLFGRTLGLVGFGNVGQEVAWRARAFGMPVVVWSRRFLAASDGAGPAAMDLDASMAIATTPEELAGRSDIVSVHLALTPDTRGLVNAGVLQRMKTGAFFINTARAEIVDDGALEAAIESRHLRVGLDVYASEPAAATAAFADPLAMQPRVYGTHHIGASTDQAQEAIAAEAVRIVTGFQRTGKVEHAVNLARASPATWRLVVRHRDRPGVLAHVLGHLREARLNVQEMDNVIFEGAEAAVAHISLDGAPEDAVLAAIRDGNRDVLNVQRVPV
jgi:D-3-phosphoglycerate dehydrogenase